MDSKPTESSSEKTNFWEDLLKDRYEVHKVEEFNALGKGKRSRKQVVHSSCRFFFLNERSVFAVNSMGIWLCVLASWGHVL